MNTTFYIFAAIAAMCVIVYISIPRNSYLHEIKKNREKLFKNQQQFLTNPPPSSKYLRYIPENYFYTAGIKVFGEFIFKASDVKNILQLQLNQPRALRPEIIRHLPGSEAKIADFYSAEINPSNMYLDWLNSADESTNIPVPVPEAWEGFNYIAEKLLKNNRGTITCRVCNRQLISSEIMKTNNLPGLGKGYAGLTCNAEHILFAYERTYISVPSFVMKTESTTTKSTASKSF